MQTALWMLKIMILDFCYVRKDHRESWKNKVGYEPSTVPCPRLFLPFPREVPTACFKDPQQGNSEPLEGMNSSAALSLPLQSFFLIPYLT